MKLLTTTIVALILASSAQAADSSRLTVSVYGSGGPKLDHPVLLKGVVVRVTTNGKLVARALTGDHVRFYLPRGIYRVAGSLHGRPCTSSRVWLGAHVQKSLSISCSVK
jgi:hypothetical protein